MKTKGPRCSACGWYTELDPRPNANGRWRCRNAGDKRFGPYSQLAPSLDNEGRAVVNAAPAEVKKVTRKPRQFISHDVKLHWLILDLLVWFKEQHAVGSPLRDGYRVDCEATRDKIKSLGEPDEAKAICENMQRDWQRRQRAA